MRLRWPRRGLNEATSFTEQPPESTPSLQNVLAFDPRSGRNRGGSRSGLSKYCPEQINSSPVQNINHISDAVGVEAVLLESGNDLYLEDDTPLLLEESASVDVGDRKTILVGVAGGTAKVITSDGTNDITSGTGTLSSTQSVIFSTPFGGDLYYTDSYVYRVYYPSTNIITTWSASLGALPSEAVDGESRTASLIVTWGGRIVLSGLISDSQNWFMSAVDDPMDFDYSPSTTTISQAVAGNNAPAGLVGDRITALIPYTDDVLIFGGDSTIWRLRGNPAEDGRIDRVSDITGIAFGQAWCKSPEGIVYFFGSRGGVYKLDPNGGVPSRLTANSIDERLADINLNDNQVSLVWDDRHIGVRVIITPRAIDGEVQEEATHFFWDVRNEAWYIIRHANKYHNALAVHLFDGPDPNDRAVLVGTQDGWILKFDPDAYSDDGYPIESYVLLGPLEDVTIAEIRATLASTSGNVQWSIHTDDDLQSAIDADAATGGELASGKNPSQWPKHHIDSGFVKLASTSPWALESLILTVEPDTEQRSRIF